MAVIAIPGFFEPFSSMVHLLVAGIVVMASASIVRAGSERAHRGALAVFALGAAALFGLSGTYHLLDGGGHARAVLQRLDHAAIFMMIAGTFTAIHGVAFRGRWRGAFLSVVWVVAVTSLTLKTIFFHAMPEWGGLVLYLGLGWLGIFTSWALWRRHGWIGVRSLLAGGLAYSLGAAYDFARGPAWIDGVVGPHEVFHLATVAGAFLHWRCIRTLLDLHEPDASRPDSSRPGAALPVALRLP